MSEFWINTKITESPWRAWDMLILGGETFPGICKLECGVEQDIEITKFPVDLTTSPVKTGVAMIDKGFWPATVRATIEVFDKDSWEDLQSILPKFSPRNTKDKTSGASTIQARGAFDIVHPATTLLGITSVIVKAIKLPPIEDQTLVVGIEMLQYFSQYGTRTVFSGNGVIDSSQVNIPKAKP